MEHLLWDRLIFLCVDNIFFHEAMQNLDNEILSEFFGYARTVLTQRFENNLSRKLK